MIIALVVIYQMNMIQNPVLQHSGDDRQTNVFTSADERPFTSQMEA